MPERENELEQYAKTFGIYDQIISLQKFMASISQIFLGANAAIWIIMLGEKITLSSMEKIVLLTILAFSSIWLVWLFVGITGAIRLRFALLEKIGNEYFPGIKEMGEVCFRDAYSGFLAFGAASWGKSRWFWFLTPVIGLLVNLWLIIRIHVG